MPAKRWPNLATMFFDQAAVGGDAPFLWSKHDGEYRTQSWRQVADEVNALSRGLRAAGVKPGDRVALVSENRPNWAVADLAILSAGAITVPGYTTNTVDDHKHIFGDSGASALIISGPAMAERALPAAHDTPGLDLVVTMDPVDSADALGVAAPDHGTSFLKEIS